MTTTHPVERTACLEVSRLSCTIVLVATFIFGSLPFASYAAGESDKDDKNFALRSGNYIALSGAWTEPSDDISIPGAFVNGVVVFPQTSVSLNSGYAGMAAFGIYQGYMRGEVEFGYRNNDISSITSFPAITAGSGNVGAFTIMVNGYGDLPITRRISAYIGGGLGVAFLDMNGRVTQGIGTGYNFDSSSTAFALQGMAGLNFKVGRRLTLTGGIRAWTALGVDTAFVSTGGVTVVHAESNNRFDLPLMYGPEVGLRFDF